LIPNGPHPESSDARTLFAQLVARPEIRLAYVSGRDIGRINQAITEYRLPRPDNVIADVGSSIYATDSQGGWQEQVDWTNQISGDWRQKTANQLASLLEDIPGLHRQEADRQGRCKLSYYAAVDADTSALSNAIQQRLESQRIAARLIWSIDTPAGRGLLDILPRSASKYHAIRWLMARTGFSEENTVFCGDSGNDLEVLVSAVPAVLVANADPDIQEIATAAAIEAGLPDRLYLARGGWQQMNGNYAAGIIEGLTHYQPRVTDWINELARHADDRKNHES